MIFSVNDFILMGSKGSGYLSRKEFIRNLLHGLFEDLILAKENDGDINA